MTQVSIKCLALRYLSLNRYEDPELFESHNIKLHVLNGMPGELVTAVTGHLHDAAVRTPARKGAKDRLIWFDFMTALEDIPGYAARIGTETMENWFAISPPAFYIVCFPKAPEYVAIVPHHIAWKDREYWCNTVTIPGPYFPYILAVDQVYEALSRISTTGEAARYKNPGTDVVLHTWLPTSSFVQDFPELDPSQVNVVTPIPEPDHPVPQSVGRKRCRQSSTGPSVSTLPPSLRPTSTAFSSKEYHSPGNISQAIPVLGPYLDVEGDPPVISQDDIWSQWLGGGWPNNQQQFLDYTEPVLSQVSLTTRSQAIVVLTGHNSTSPSILPWKPEDKLTSSGPDSENGIVAVCSVSQYEQSLLPPDATSPAELVANNLSTDWSPLFALPSEQQEAVLTPLSPIEAIGDLTSPKATTSVRTVPSRVPTPQDLSEHIPRRMLELYNLHPWGNHIYLSGSSQLTPSLLLSPSTPCLLLLTSYAETYLANTPTPLQNLDTVHPCMHIIASISEPNKVWVLPSRDVQAYTCHLQALKQGTVNALGAKKNARCGLRGKNKQRTEAPCVRDVIEWVGAKKIRVEDLESELGKRYATESERKRPRGAEDGELWRAVATVGDLLQAQVDGVWG